jgi:hypothetical protein
MNALSVCQPFASLIISGEKRVENRRWSTSYRGPLLIHAGKSRKWLGGWDGERMPDPMPFGAQGLFYVPDDLVRDAIARAELCVHSQSPIPHPRPLPGRHGPAL